MAAAAAAAAAALASLAGVTTAFRDPDDAASVMTRAVKAESVDSAGRDNVLTTTSSAFTVAFSEPIRRAGTLQVGDCVLPTDALTTVDASRRHFGVSGGIATAVPTAVTVQETVNTYALSDGALLSSVARAPVVTVLPPTLNQVVSVSGANLVTLTMEHGLAAATAAYWPPAAAPFFVGTRALSYDPVVAAADVATLNTASAFTPTAGWIAALTAATAGGAVAFADALVGAADAAWLYTPPLTAAEVAAAVNAALAASTAATDLLQPYSLTLRAEDGTVRLQAMGGDYYTATTRREVVARFTVTDGDALAALGFRVGTWRLPTYASERLAADGRRAATAPYVYTVLPRVTRTIEMRAGNYTAAELAAALTARTNSLYFPLATSIAERTFYFTDTLGAVASFVLPAGRYTATQAAAYLQAQMAAAGGGAATWTVAFDAADGTFSFTSDDGMPWALDFSDATSATLAAALGFEPLRYTGAASYVSGFRAVCGQNTASAGVEDLPRVLSWSADTVAQHFRVAADDVLPPSWVATLVGVAGANVATATATVDGAAVAPHLQPYDVVRLLVNGGTASVTAVVTAASSGATPSTVELHMGAVVVGAGQDFDWTVPATVASVARAAWLLHAQRVPEAAGRLPLDDLTGTVVFNPLLPAVSPGTAGAYGPMYATLGAAPAVVEADGVYVLPNGWKLSPPDVVYLILKSPEGTSRNFHFRPLAQPTDTRAVLAKYNITATSFANVSEAMTHVTLTSTQDVARISVAWQYGPDGTPVDWHGRDVSFTLLARVHEGKAGSLVED